MSEDSIFKSLHPFSQNISKAIACTLTLYAISTMLSITAMEVFGWLSAILVLAVLAIEYFRSNPIFKRLILPVDYFLLGFLAVVVFGAFLNDLPKGYDFTRMSVIGDSRWVLLFFLLRIGLTICWSDRFVKKVIAVLTTILIVVSIYAIWQYFSGVDLIRGARHIIEPFGFHGSRPFYRAEGVFGSPMTFAYSIVLALSFPLALLLSPEGSRRGKLFFGLAVLVISLALITTLTRGAWLAAAGALSFFLLFSWNKRLIAFALLLALVFGGFSLIAPEIAGRAKAVADTKDSSNQGRFDLWRVNLEMFKANPLVGVGYNMNEYLVLDYYPRIGKETGRQGHAHNTYLQILSGTGLLGFIFFAGFLIYYFALNWKIMRRVTDPWHVSLLKAAFAAQIALHIGGLTECNFKDLEVNHLFLLVLASLSAIYIRNVSSKKEVY